jgi:hypothetical protein
MHKPHSPQLYVALLKNAKRLNALIDLGELHGAMLGSLDGPSEYAKGMVLTGEIYRFVKLDASEPWFNLQTSKQASDDDMGAIRIPRHLLPHLQRIDYLFRPDIHELWFVSEDRKDRLGAQAAVTFFQRLFDLVYQGGKCTQVEVTALPDVSSLEVMLSLHKLERMIIDLKRPNADDAASDEARLLKKLENQGIRHQQMQLVAAAGESIKPDQETQTLAAVAARNGSVSVVGKDAGGLRVEESTVAKPMILTRLVNSAMETASDVLRRTALGK